MEECGKCVYCLSRSDEIGMCNLSMLQKGLGSLVKKKANGCNDHVDEEGLQIEQKGW